MVIVVMNEDLKDKDLAGDKLEHFKDVEKLFQEQYDYAWKEPEVVLFVDSRVNQISLVYNKFRTLPESPTMLQIIKAVLGEKHKDLDSEIEDLRSFFTDMDKIEQVLRERDLQVTITKN